MAQSFDGAESRFQRPWYWLAVLLAGVVLASVVVARNARARIDQNREQFAAAEMLRLQRMAGGITALFSDSANLVRLEVALFAHGDGHAQVERAARDLFASRPAGAIYGLGPFFVRGGSGEPGTYFSVYVRRYDPGLRWDPRFYHRLRDGDVEVVYDVARPAAADDYTRQRWFLAGMQKRGTRVVYGPYLAGNRRFISTVQAISHHGRFIGVATADTLLTDFVAALRTDLIPGDVAWISTYRTHKPVVRTATIPSSEADRLVRSISLPYTRAMLSLSGDSRPVAAANREVLVGSATLIFAMWVLAALIAIGMLQRWRSRERQHAMEIEQRRLEREIALGKIVEDELRKAAYTDALTGLPNRAAFLEHVRGVLGSGAQGCAIFFIDLDHFNIVNETLGHLAGDDLLRTVGARLQATMESTDLVARLGGDEFVMVAGIAPRTPDETATLFLAHLGQPVVLHGRPIYPQASIGVVVIDDSYASAEELLRDADIAMYEAKHRGRAQYAIFDHDMRLRVAAESQLKDDLHRAIERGELITYYQPIVSVPDGHIVAFEALVRWNHPDGRLREAAEFMHFAEQRGFVEAIDGHVMRSVCAHARAIFDIFPSAVVTVNVSAADLVNVAFGDTVAQHLAEYEFDPSRIRLEITETAMMTSSEAARHSIERLRALGIQLLLDDFGTGYSSLAYLQRLPISGIKIDRSFVQAMLDDPKALEIVRSVVALAKSFGLHTTAEGVETARHFHSLAAIGVDHAQGFFFSRAVEIGAISRFANGSPPSQAAVE